MSNKEPDFKTMSNKEFSLYNFALVLHLYLLEHGGGFVLKKLLISHASLRLF